MPTDGGEVMLKPILAPYDALGSSRYTDFDTTRSVYQTDPTKCHVPYIALDSQWEAKLAESLEHMPEVITYIKNDHVGFTIPYTMDGEQHDYVPDYIVRVDDGHGSENPLNLIVEVTGELRKDKAVKAATARSLWV